MYWRNGDTTVPVSWAELLVALKRAGLGGVTDDIAVQHGLKPVSGWCMQSRTPLSV